MARYKVEKGRYVRGHQYWKVVKSNGEPVYDYYQNKEDAESAAQKLEPMINKLWEKYVTKTFD